MSFQFNSYFGTFQENFTDKPIGRGRITPDQSRAIERIRDSNGKLLIAKYIAGGVRYTLTKSNYGKQLISTHTAKVFQKSNYLSDAGLTLTLSSSIFLIVVDLQKKEQLEGEVAELNGKLQEIGRKGEAKKKEEQFLRGEIERIQGEFDKIADKKKTISKIKQALTSAETRLEQKRKELTREENRPDTTEIDLTKIKEQQIEIARKREEIATTLTVLPLLSLLIQEYVKETMQLTDDIIVAKMKCIQAEADQSKVTAEAGNASQELEEAIIQYRVCDEKTKAASAIAKQLMKEIQKNLFDLGKTPEEGQALIAVLPTLGSWLI